MTRRENSHQRYSINTPDLEDYYYSLPTTTTTVYSYFYYNTRDRDLTVAIHDDSDLF